MSQDKYDSVAFNALINSLIASVVGCLRYVSHCRKHIAKVLCKMITTQKIMVRNFSHNQMFYLCKMLSLLVGLSAD